ncbi:MAG TPA: DAK2 domain-containing protein [Thermoanaerobaculia bacterium]|nr:DAK2 domain-containing protein [Thermoanaerobaculia bacterium]
MTGAEPAPSAAEPERLSGPELRRFFAGGLEALRGGAQAINSLNVFPVPDGDTGTNMVATLAAALRMAAECRDCDLGSVAAGLARGALLEARGNSGVILAQLLAGLAASFAGAAETGSEGWAAAWRKASQAAWRSVGTPMEGTVLTVVREAAEAAEEAARANLPLVAAWRFMADAADLAVQRTTRLLPVLEEAEVVDAGGLGLALVVRGGLAAFTGEPLPSLKRLPAPSERTRRVIANASFPRYCTELVLTATGLDRTALDARLRQLGDCVDLTGGTAAREETLHIHIHTDEPEALFAYAATLGTVSHRKVEDMEAQRARFLAGPEPQETGWVAVAAGEGMRRVFENLPGVAGVIDVPADAPLEQTELAAALAHASAAQLLLLANDPALWPAAQAAAAASARPALAVLTATLPEGIAAALAFDPAAPLADNAEAMLAAARNVRTVAASPGTFEAAEEEIAALGDGFSLVTLYTGAGASPEQADELAARLQRRFPGLETEVVEGGQPAPPLLLAVE